MKGFIRRLFRVRLTSRPRELRLLKDEILSQVEAECKSIVSAGPFQGLKLPFVQGWGTAPDRINQLLGTYEPEVVTAIQQLRSVSDIFIDIGAASGFYAVGAAKCLGYKNVICYELSRNGQEAISATATLNNVAHKVSIFGEFKVDSIYHIHSACSSKCVVLIDIEGGEFTLLTTEFFSHFRLSSIIIEVHDWLNPSFQVEQLQQLGSLHHNSEFILPKGKNPAAIPILANMHEDYQWLACSENRDRAMKWLLFTPKNKG